MPQHHDQIVSGTDGNGDETVPGTAGPRRYQQGMDQANARTTTVSSDALDIDIRLEHLDHLFVLPDTDLFSEYRNWLTGIDYAIGEVRGRWRSRPVRLTLRVPADQATSTSAAKVKRSIERFCTHRIAYNDNEIRAMRRDGVGALVIGLFILLIGVAAAKYLRDHSTIGLVTDFLADGLILVVAWVGMWYPLDTLVYNNRPYKMENRALHALTAAEVRIVTDP